MSISAIDDIATAAVRSAIGCRPVQTSPADMDQVAITLEQARQRFKCAHAAALKADPLCKTIYDRWKAELLAAGSGEPEGVPAVMYWKLAIAFEVIAERKGWPDNVR